MRSATVKSSPRQAQAAAGAAMLTGTKSQYVLSGTGKMDNAWMHAKCTNACTLKLALTMRTNQGPDDGEFEASRQAGGSGGSRPLCSDEV